MDTQTIVESLLDDHVQMRRTFKLFMHELDRFSKGEHPDYDVLAGALDYLRDYLDAVHHPLEDHIAEHLIQHEPSSAVTKSLKQIHQMHEDLEALTIEVSREFSAVRDGTLAVRERLCSLGSSMVDAYQNHLSWEEARFFPLAQRSMTEADWAAILEKSNSELNLAHAKQVRDRFAMWLSGYDDTENQATAA